MVLVYAFSQVIVIVLHFVNIYSSNNSFIKNLNQSKTLSILRQHWRISQIFENLFKGIKFVDDLENNLTAAD